MQVILESLLRLGMVAFAGWLIWALWVSRPVGDRCLVCRVQLQRAEVVHCSDCLGV